MVGQLPSFGGQALFQPESGDPVLLLGGNGQAEQGWGCWPAAAHRA